MKSDICRNICIIAVLMMLILCFIPAAAAVHESLVTATAYEVSVQADSVIQNAGFTIDREHGKTSAVVLQGNSVIITYNLPSGYTAKTEYAGNADVILNGYTITVKNIQSNVIIRLSAERTYTPSHSGGGGHYIPPIVNPQNENPQGENPPGENPQGNNPQQENPPVISEPAIIQVSSAETTIPARITDITQTYQETPIFNSAVNTIDTLQYVSAESAEAIKNLLHEANPSLSETEISFASETIQRAAEANLIHPTEKNAPLLLTNTSQRNVVPYLVLNVEPAGDPGAVQQIDFIIPLADLEKAGISIADVILYHGYPEYHIWVPLDTYFTGTNPDYTFYTAYTHGASPFAVLFMKDMTIMPDEMNGVPFAWWQILIFIGTVLLIVILIVLLIRHRMKKEKPAFDPIPNGENITK